MKKIFLFILSLALIFYFFSNNKSLNNLYQKILTSSKTQLKQDKSLSIDKNIPNTLNEEVITKIVEKSIPSVVTVSIKKLASTGDYFEINPFNPFSPFRRIPGKKQKIEQNIGSGFIISADGLIITNKHVVSDKEAEYQVLTNDKKKYDVEKIYRDPLNDLAILKVNPKNDSFSPLSLGNSNNLKLGQTAIAIGTPLGEFTNTVTVGIISGLGRGITAGSPYEGFVEKLDNVIQTDAAINPGNSGGPLLNSKGEVIGVNTAIAQEGQNIGFAIPVNAVKELIDKFNQNGGNFQRPYLGIRYQMIDRQTALLNKLPQGAYVIQVLENSPAEKAGVKEDDIITEIDGKSLPTDDETSLSKLIGNKKVGDKVNLKIYREEKFINILVTLEPFE